MTLGALTVAVESTFLLGDRRGWMVIATLLALLLGVMAMRRFAGRARAGRPWCGRCGHLLSQSDAPRCSECGEALASPSRGIRWDRASTRRIVFSSACGVLVSACVAALLTGVVLRWPARTAVPAARLIPAQMTLHELADHALNGPGQQAAASQLLSRARALAAHERPDEIIEALVDAMPAEGVVRRPDPEVFMASLILSSLHAAFISSAGASPDPGDGVATLAEGMLGSAPLSLRHRHRAGESVTIAEPRTLTRSHMEVESWPTSVTVDGVKPHQLQMRRRDEEGTWWIRFTAGDAGPARLRVEWSFTLSIGPRGNRQRVLERSFVHEQELEFVDPSEPTLVPTSDPRHWPLATGALRWRLALQPFGRNQLVGLVVTVPASPNMLLEGRWELQQGERVVAIGAPVTTLGEGGLDEIRIALARFADSLFDIDAPMTLRLVPRAPRFTGMMTYDRYWSDPLEAVIPADATRWQAGLRGRMTAVGTMEPASPSEADTSNAQ